MHISVSVDTGNAEKKLAYEVIAGRYQESGSGTYHGRPVFRKPLFNDGDDCARRYQKSKGIFIYFDIDSEDGFAAWYVGHEVGGDMVWALHDDTTCMFPPNRGWTVVAPIDEWYLEDKIDLIVSRWILPTAQWEYHPDSKGKQIWIGQGQLRFRICDSCHVWFAGPKKRWCSGCFNQVYCSQECQVKHWPEHRPECKLHWTKLNGEPSDVPNPEGTKMHFRPCVDLEKRQDRRAFY